MNTRVEPDGTGTFSMDMSASAALLELGQKSGEIASDDMQFDKEDIENMRAMADTTPGLHYDTAYTTQTSDRRGVYVRFAFDSVGVIKNVVESQDTEQMTFPVLEQSDRMVRLNYHPTMDFGSEAESDNPFGQMGTEMALKMVDMRFRFIFPKGTAVDTAKPAIRQTDSTVVYEWGMREMVNASDNRDSLYVTAKLPPSRPNLTLWLAVGLFVVLLLASVVLLRKRSG